MQVIKLINSGSKILKDNNILTYKLDSEILLSKVLNKTREELLINLNQNISSNKIRQYQKYIKRRLSKEPIAYILRKKEFWSKNFEVNKSVLIPRPETELLVEKIVKIFKSKRISILDIGTGTGCILISIISELDKAHGIGIDVSNKALKVARKNLQQFKLSHKIRLLKRSISQPLNYKFDLIVSNPPYIDSNSLRNLDDDVKKFEPKLALDGGNDGLDVIKKVIYKSKNILKDKGMLALEIGNEQYKKVSIILKKNRFRIKYLVNDYKENVRCILSTLEN